MLLIILMLFLCSSFCSGEQLLRETWSQDSGSSLLYRVSDEISLAEISFLSGQNNSWKPGVFILQTDSFQIGSLQSSGIWKFSSMSTLVKNKVLRQKHGLIPNRAGHVLSNPSASFYTNSGGGGMIQSDKNLLQYSLWQSFHFNMYTPLTVGFSKTQTEVLPEDDQEWFSVPSDTGDNFYFAVSDLKTDTSHFGLHFQTAGSFSEYLSPGFSILPVCTIFAGLHDLTIRYWYNSGHWINRNLERPDWQHYWDSEAHVYIGNGLTFETDAYVGANKDAYCQKQGFSFCLISDTGLSWKQIGYSQDRSILDNQWIVHQNADVSLKKTIGFWIYSADGRVRFEGSRLIEWLASGSLKMMHHSGMTSHIKLSWKAEPGLLNFKPLYNESLQFKNIKLKLSGGYIFCISEPREFNPESLVLQLQLEWHQR